MTGLTHLRKSPAAWLLLCALILYAVGCRRQDGETIVVSQSVDVAGEDMVVTRVIGNMGAPPATITLEPGQEAGVLDISMSGEPGVIDPHSVNTPNETTLVENLFAGLTRYDQALGQVVPELAEAWDVSDDGTTWTFHLREDIYWISPRASASLDFLQRESGRAAYRPVIADDIVFSVQRACDPRVPTPDALVLFIIQGCEEVQRNVAQASDARLDLIRVEATGEHTVVFHLTQPAAYFLTITSLPLMRAVPREVVAAYAESDTPWAMLDTAVTSGPFVVGDSENQDITLLERNPYWPIAFGGTIDRVNIHWLDAVDAYEMWLVKDLDVGPLPSSRRDELSANRSLAPRLRLVPRQSMFFLSFNFDSPVFSDPAVRRAFSAAIDRQLLVEDVYGGLGLPMRHFTPPGAFGAPPIDRVGTGYSPDFARLEMGSSSVRDCAFLPEIRYLVSNTDLSLQHAETLRDMWSRELDCPEEKILIEQVPFGTLLANTRPDAGAERPDLWDLGWASYYPDAHNWLADILHCTLSENRANRPCTEADRLIAAAATEQDPAQRHAQYEEVERLFFGEAGSMPLAPLFVDGTYILVHPWLTFEPAHFGGEQFDQYNLDAVTKRLERQQ